MRPLSYTITPNLQQNLRSVEDIRERILLYPLSAADELRLRWEANLSRLYYSLHLAHSPVTQKDIITALTSGSRRQLSPQEREIINYKRGIDYINREWLVNKKPIMPATVQKLYKIVTEEKMHMADADLMELLVFLQTSSESSLVQAFIAYTQFMIILPVSDSSSKVIRLIPYLFLYKAGLDYRGLLVLESYFYRNEHLLRELVVAIEKKESMTVWIEHFVQGMSEELEGAYTKFSQVNDNAVYGSFWELTERQKEILSAFEQPGARITNRKVQQFFHISQITASRDLAKLASLGMLFPYGKGRAVYYMRA